MPFGKLHFLRFALVLILISLFAGLLMAQQPAPRQRILQSIDNTRLTKLSGNTHPLARAEYDRGRAPDSLAADRILLLLSRTPEQEAALAQLLDDQQTVGSANYRRWLTPEEFGQQFGAADADIQTITAWLQTQGFQINSVSASKNLIEFSGTAGQVRNSFHTELHKYAVGGKEYWANAADPHIPTALLPVVKGLVSLNNFPHKPQYRKLGALPRNAQGKPEMTGTINGTTFYGVGPADFATIYKTSSLLSAGTTGSGQTIAIIGDSNIDLQDVTDFRSFFSLTGGSASVVVDGTDPGIVPGDSVEALLDVQWSGAVAPGANVKLVTAQQTTTTAGIFLAANYAIQQNIGGILSLSFGSCEPYLGTAGNQYVQALWQQASAQGITVLVSTGDEGSAGCDYHAYSDIAQNGLAVNGFASTPYNIAVGGTDFDDANSFATYWNATNNAAYGSAKSYIPEKTWNETCAATATANNLAVCPTWNGTGTPPAGISVVAGSGGASNCSTSTSDVYGNVTCQSGTPKPQWQSGTGVLNDGVRDIPDVSLFAAAWDTDSKSSYVIMESGDLYTIGGTSASAPSFAGIVALFNQKANTRLGNLNYLLYSIAANAGSSCSSSGSEAASCVFNDVTKGNISVPCVAGTNNCSVTSGTATGVLIDNSRKPAFTTTSGYDLATGLGSVNAANLATAILTAKGKFTPTTTALTLNSGTSTVTAKHGDPISVGVNVTPTTATGPIAVQDSNGQGIDNATLVSGSSTWYSSLFPGGNYTVTAHYPGDGTRAASDSNSVQVNISPEGSKTFLEVMSWDDSGNFLTYNASSLAYGSNYIVRVDVADAAATLSNSTGLSSKCSNGTASCPTGTVTLTQNGAPLDAGSYKLNSAGHAEDQIINLFPAKYTLAANYSGDASYNPSTAQSTLTVTTAPVNITFTPPPNVPNGLQYGTPYSFAVNVAALGYGVSPSGTITVLDNGVPMSPALGSFSYSRVSRNGSTPAYLGVSGWIQFQTIGDHVITIQYSGDTNYQQSTSAPTTLTVVKATPIITVFSVAPNPTAVNLPVAILFRVNGSSSLPTGTVTLTDNGSSLNATLNITGQSSTFYDVNATIALGSQGSHDIVANYPGDNYYAAVSTKLATITVYNLVPTTTATPSAVSSPALPNQAVTFTTIVDSSGGPIPKGAVIFYDNGIAFTEQPSSYGYSLSDSYVAITHAFSTTGTHSITATYQGDSNTAASTSPALAFSVVDKLPTTTYLYTSGNVVANQQSSLAIWASPQTTGNGSWPQVTGTFTVSENGTPLNGTITTSNSNPTLNGTFQYTFTTTGTHNLTVQYSGDSNYASSQSQAAINVVGVLSFNLPFGNTVSFPSTGGTTGVTIYVSNNIASSENVTLTCTPDSSQATCSLTPPTMSINANQMSPTTLYVTVPALSAAEKHPTAPWHGKGGLLLGAAFACCVLAARRKRKHMLLIAGVLVLAFGMLSCGGGGSSSGGGGNPPPPTSKTYHFTVKATDGTNTATQVITVTVGS